jgi:CRISPR-associated protein Cas4
VQTDGLAAHNNIDNKSYSTSTHILQSLEIYSEVYKLCGKIDLYDQQNKMLIERKKRIKTIYDGYIFQVYAQYHCLTEMGYQINSIKLHSLDDNKRYTIALPTEDLPMQNKFEQLIKQIKSFDLQKPFIPNANKCNHCIYHALCDHSLADETHEQTTPIC